MKLAKAEEKEFDKVYGFINVMDGLFDSRFFSREEDWRDWNDDDEDKKLLLEIEKEIKETDGKDAWGIQLNKNLRKFSKIHYFLI